MIYYHCTSCGFLMAGPEDDCTEFTCPHCDTTTIEVMPEEVIKRLQVQDQYDPQKSSTFYKIMLGLGTPQEQIVSVDRIKELLKEPVVDLRLEMIDGRCVCDRLYGKSYVLYLASSPEGAVIYRVKEIENASSRSEGSDG